VAPAKGKAARERDQLHDLVEMPPEMVMMTITGIVIGVPMQILTQSVRARCAITKGERSPHF